MVWKPSPTGSNFNVPILDLPKENPILDILLSWSIQTCNMLLCSIRSTFARATAQASRSDPIFLHWVFVMFPSLKDSELLLAQWNSSANLLPWNKCFKPNHKNHLYACVIAMFSLVVFIHLAASYIVFIHCAASYIDLGQLDLHLSGPNKKKYIFSLCKIRALWSQYQNINCSPATSSHLLRNTLTPDRWTLVSLERRVKYVLKVYENQ